MTDILADIDAAIEEHEGYVEWHGSDDSATWTADGSHEVDTGGHYYGDDESPVLESYALPRMFIAGMAEGDIPVPATRFDHDYGRAVAVLTAGLRARRTYALLEAQRHAHGITDEQWQRICDLAERSGFGVAEWQRRMIEATRAAADALASVAEHIRDESFDETLHPTVAADDRRKHPRRTGRDAQTSPYQIGRRR